MIFGSNLLPGVGPPQIFLCICMQIKNRKTFLVYNYNLALERKNLVTGNFTRRKVKDISELFRGGGWMGISRTNFQKRCLKNFQDFPEKCSKFLGDYYFAIGSQTPLLVVPLQHVRTILGGSLLKNLDEEMIFPTGLHIVPLLYRY